MCSRSRSRALQFACWKLSFWFSSQYILLTYEFIGGYRRFHGGKLALFDNSYTDGSMYHSDTCRDERGIVIDFKDEVKYHDLKIHTRSSCCKDRYFGVCLYADDVKVSCTPRKRSKNFKHWVKIVFRRPMLQAASKTRKRSFKLKWFIN